MGDTKVKIYKDVVATEAFDRPVEVKGTGIVHASIGSNNTAFFWYELDENHPTEIFRYMVVGTGWPYPNNFYHVATYIDGPFVWHIVQEVR